MINSENKSAKSGLTPVGKNSPGKHLLNKSFQNHPDQSQSSTFETGVADNIRPSKFSERLFGGLSSRHRKTLNPSEIGSFAGSSTLSRDQNSIFVQSKREKNAETVFSTRNAGDLAFGASKNNIANQSKADLSSEADIWGKQIPSTTFGQDSTQKKKELSTLFSKLSSKSRRSTIGRQPTKPTQDLAQNKVPIMAEKQPAPPLIPESKIDAPTQRRYFLSLSFLILAFLLLDVGISALESKAINQYNGADKDDLKDLQRKNTWRFLKWSFISVLYSVLVFSLKIPRLVFNKQQVMALFFFITFLNLNLFIFKENFVSVTLRAGASVLSTGAARLIWKIPFTGPVMLQDSNLLIDGYTESEDNILGKYVVEVLPLSSVSINPYGKCFCVTKQSTPETFWSQSVAAFMPKSEPKYDSAYIPLAFNGTQAHRISYKFTSLENGQESVVSQRIDKKYMKVVETYKSPKNWQLANYLLKVSKPGLYNVQSVVDANGKSFQLSHQINSRYYTGDVVVVECPNGRLELAGGSSNELDQIKHLENEIHICARDIDSEHSGSPGRLSLAQSGQAGLLQVSASGFEPIELMIERDFNGCKEVLSLDGIQPRSYDTNFSAKDNKDAWKRYKAQSLRYNIAESFVGPGEYTYRLMYVRDACNHKKTLYGSSSRKNGNLERESLKSAVKNGKFVSIKVWARPRVTWDGRSVTGKSFKRSSDPARRGPIKLKFAVSGEAPWEVKYRIDPIDQSSDINDCKSVEAKTGVIKTLKVLEDSRGVIEADQAGIYKFISVADSRCWGGKVDGAAVTIVDSKPPSLTVSSQAISSERCVGEIGTRIELIFQGEGPFTAYYKERIGSQVFERRVSTPVYKHILKLTPEHPGLYEYTFYKIVDANYPTGIKTHSVVSQTVHPQPSARIVGSDLKRSCLGQTVDIDLQLLGSGPWELTYSIIRPNGATSTSTILSHKNSTSLQVGPFKSAGLHIVELVEISDFRKCRRKLQLRSTLIIRENGPTAEFICPAGGIKTLEGKPALLPVRIEGEAPLDLTYVWHGNTSNVMSKKILKSEMSGSTYELSLPVTAIGTYELLMVYDYCSGTIGANSRCSISVEPKPRVWFQSPLLTSDTIPQVRSACQSSSVSGSIVNIELEGRGPWTVKYLVQRWNDVDDSGPPESQSAHESVVVGQSPSTLKLNSTEPGFYKYALVEVSDQLYTSPQGVRHAALQPTIIKQKVSPNPIGSLVVYSADGKRISSSKNRAAGRPANPYNSDLSPIQLCVPRGSPLSDDYEWRKVYSEYAPKIHLEIENLPMLSPPFTAWVELSPANSLSKIIETPSIPTFNHTLDLSDYLPAQIGKFGLRIIRIVDSNGCVYARPAIEGMSVEAGIEIEYIEAPTLKPSQVSISSGGSNRNPAKDSRDTDEISDEGSSSVVRNVCKGDVLSFDIIGYPSWSVQYKYNERTKSTVLNKPVFKKLMEIPGNFSVQRVCHQITNSCCADLSNLDYVVHPLPSARVSGGQNVQQSINQGEKVEINIELRGEAPFTFTWQRKSLPKPGNKGAPAKVLETHTIQNYEKNVYTLVTSLEGVFQVTYIQDKHCHYPRSKSK